MSLSKTQRLFASYLCISYLKGEILLFGISKLLLNLQEKNLVVVILLFILALLFAILTYKHTFPALSKRKKTLLLGLRILALFCLFLVLSEPILTLAKRYTQKPVVALLVDVSKRFQHRMRRNFLEYIIF